MLYSNNRAIPPFKSNPVIMESEYKRSFKGSPPPRPPRLRRDVEQYEVPLLHTENTTPEKVHRNIHLLLNVRVGAAICNLKGFWCHSLPVNSAVQKQSIMLLVNWHLLTYYLN